MSNTLVVPAEMVDLLRSGLHIELGDVSQAISEATDRSERQAHQEWFVELFDRFDAIRALLLLAGWKTQEPDQNLEVDFDAYRDELLAALTSQLRVERNVKQELDREHAARGARNAATARVLTLCRFLAELKTRLADD
jgi:hypothetical protein